VILAGQVIVHGAALMTVTLKPQLAMISFDASLPSQFTGVIPTGKVEPEGGLQMIVKVGHPLEVGSGYVTVAEPEPAGFAGATMSCGQLRTHNVLLTVTVKVQVTGLPEPALVSHVTVVAPTGKLEPDGGLQAERGAGQLSFRVGGG
jgi:hypothetical protein